MTVTGMGPDAPATATRSSRRSRRLAIVGALALVIVAGAVFVGVKTTGARGGYIAGASCQNGGTCVLGDVGPGLGTVFYVAATPFACGTATCSYLEAAPAGWRSGVATDPQLRWNLGTTTGGSDTAQNVAKQYRGGSKYDWHLPTRTELTSLNAQKSVAGLNLQTTNYWSDTAGSDSSVALYIVMRYGSWAQTSRTSQYYVRPVRAF